MAEEQSKAEAFLQLVAMVLDWDRADSERASQEVSRQAAKSGERAVAFRQLDDAMRSGAKKERQRRTQEEAKRVVKRIAAGSQRPEVALRTWAPPTPRPRV
jgi:hypothetical protein